MDYTDQNDDYDADSHRYALDAFGNWVNAHTTPFVPHADYFCDCPAKHKLKHVKPSGKEGRRHFAAYFAHIASGSKRNHAEKLSLCHSGGGGGESMQHRLAKQILREFINTVSFPCSQCPDCSCKVLVNFQNCTVKLELKSADGRWRYDCMAYNEEEVPFYALEVVHTHVSGPAKVQHTRQDGIGIAEFLCADVMGLGTTNHDGSRRRTVLRNLLVESKQCRHCFSKAVEAACLWEYEQECSALTAHETLAFTAMQAVFDHKQFLVRLDRLCCHSDFEKAMLIVEHNKAKIWIYSGLWQDISINQAFHRLTCGFSIRHHLGRYSSGVMVVLLLDDAWQNRDAREIHTELKSLAQTHQICIHRILAVKCMTVIQTFKREQGGVMTLKNCLFPILMELESSQRVCANCGACGHRKTNCIQRYCLQCKFFS